MHLHLQIFCDSSRQTAHLFQALIFDSVELDVVDECVFVDLDLVEGLEAFILDEGEILSEYAIFRTKSNVSRHSGPLITVGTIGCNRAVVILIDC